MANKKFWVGMLVMILAFGMTVVGCDDGSINDGLNGTWVTDGYWNVNGTWVNYGYSVEQKYNNGNFESTADGSPFYKGTYTTSDNKITTKTSHIGGRVLSYNYGLEEKWYSEAELKIALNSEYLMEHYQFFIGYTFTYSINGNKLTFIDESVKCILTKNNHKIFYIA
jgi:hypothetical protein